MIDVEFYETVNYRHRVSKASMLCGTYSVSRLYPEELLVLRRRQEKKKKTAHVPQKGSGAHRMALARLVGMRNSNVSG